MCAIIMDYSAEEGPVLITRHYVGPMPRRGDFLPANLARRKFIHRFPFGEADLAIPFWLSVFRDRPHKVIHTIDTDVLLHVLIFITTATKPEQHGRITWVYAQQGASKFGPPGQLVQVCFGELLCANNFL